MSDDQDQGRSGWGGEKQKGKYMVCWKDRIEICFQTAIEPVDVTHTFISSFSSFFYYFFIFLNHCTSFGRRHFFEVYVVVPVWVEHMSFMCYY